MKALTIIKPKKLAMTKKRKLLIDLYTALYTKLEMEEHISPTAAMIRRAPEHQIDMEWETVKDGTFQEVVATLLNYKLDGQDIAHLISLYQGIWEPYAKRGGDIPAEDMKFAYKEILNFTRSVRKKRELEERNKLPERDLKLLDQIAKPIESSFQEKIEAKYTIQKINSEKPSLEDTYKKIKGWDVKALAGFARRVGVESETVDQYKRDKESMLGEILGHLFGDDWMRDLMKKGLL